MQEERGVRSRKVLLRLALVLGVASALAMPAIAQASPKFFVNGIKATETKQGLVNYGEIELQNGVLGKVKCSNLASGYIWNTAPPSEKAEFITEGYTTYNCAAEPACPGVFATAEMPVEVSERKTKTGTEAIAQRGPTTLPWSGEAIEEGSEKLRKIRTRGIKVTIVAPCFSVEVPFEGVLEPLATNGAKNGLKASHVSFETCGGRTGFLTSPALPTEKQQGCVIGELKSIGTSVQLITVE
jgi:hypothetical protein